MLVKLIFRIGALKSAPTVSGRKQTSLGRDVLVNRHIRVINACQETSKTIYVEDTNPENEPTTAQETAA